MRRLPLFTDSPLRRILALSLLAAVAPACGGGGGSSAPLIVLPFYISTSGLPNGMVGTNYSQTLATGSGTAPVTWSILNGALPAGAPAFGIAAATGTTATISGKPVAPAGMSSFTVRAIDANGLIADRVFSITVLGGLAIPLAVTSPAILPAGTQGSLYTTGLDASGGTPPYTWSITGGALPVGLNINQSIGQISGVPSVAGGPTSFTVQAKDSLGATATELVSISISPTLFVTTPTLPDTTTTSTTYSQTLTESGGTAPFAWSISGGALPTGLTLSPAGVISGTVTGAAGIYGFTAEVTDASSAQVSKSFTILVNPLPTITTTTLVPWTQGFAGYSQTMLSTGGTAPITWSITGGTLPAGLLLAPATGAITGQPTGTGTSNFTAVATDAVGVAASQPLSIVINAAEVVSPGSLPPWTVNRPGYIQTITAAGGTGARALTLISGAIPTGMTFTPATGVLTGTPTVPGTFSFTVRSTDSIGAQGHTDYSVVINPPPSISTTSLPNWTINVPYSQTLLTTAATGTAPFGWAITAGTAPSPLVLSAGGVLSGTPNASGPSTFTVTVTDAAGATASQQYVNLTINPALNITTPSPMPAWTQGRAGYSQTLVATGGTGAQTWAVTGGNYPTGMAALTAGGVIAGTPSAAGTYTFTVQVTDSVGGTATKSLTITVNQPVQVTNPANLASWTQNRSGYTDTFTSSNGTGAVTWSITVGALPTGLSFNTGTGAISGTPTAVSGDYTFTATATDTVGATGSKSLTIHINAPVTVSNPSNLAAWTQNKSGYTDNFTSTGGTGAITWSITTGALPTGLSFNTVTGAISGTPTAASGDYIFTATGTDTVGATGSKSLTIHINVPIVENNSANLTTWTQNHAGYTDNFTSTGGTGAITWSITVNALPAGLSFNTGTGAISGTPTAVSGDYIFTATATDTVGATGSKSLTIHINAPVTVSNPSNLAAWTQNIPGYTDNFTSSGGTGAVTWSITVGALPAGLSFNTGTGAISGTPTAVSGDYIFTATGTDAVGATGSKSLTIHINAPVTVSNPSNLASWTQNKSGYTDNFTSMGGTGAVRWSITVGALPAGLSFNAGTGAISGTPTAAPGDYTFTATGTDTLLATGSKSLTIHINAPLTENNSSNLSSWTQNKSGYLDNFTTSGGTAPITWSITVGALPTGLSFIAGTGAITGNPTAAPGDYTFTATATDSVLATDSKSLTIHINAPVVVSNPSNLASWTQGRSGYTDTLTSTGGTGPVIWSITSGGLPAGLSFNASTGHISGNPSATSGDYTFTATATDSVSATGSMLLTIHINGMINVTKPNLASWTQGRAGYSDTLTSTGGTGAINWSIGGGALPTGLSLDANSGIISGTPTAAPGDYNFNVTATDTVLANASRFMSIHLNPPPVITTPTSLPDGQVGIPYSLQFQNSGGTGPFNWSSTSNPPLPGLTLTTNGLLSGTPSPGPSFFVTVTDATGATASGTFSLNVEGTLSITTSSLPSVAVNTSYAGTPALAATGGLSPYSFLLLSGTLPGSINFNGAGTWGGTSPASNGVNNFTVRVTDANGRTADKALSIATTGGSGSLTIVTTTLSAGTQGGSYNAGLTGSGGNPASYSWSMSGGTLLPPGLSLSASGVISGTPSTTAGSPFGFTVALNDGSGPVTQALSITINGPLVITTPGALPGWTASGPGTYSQPLSRSGGTSPFTWGIASGSIPGGMTLSSGGTLSGVPNAAGTFNFSAQVSDSGGATTTQPFSIQINPTPQLQNTGQLQGTQNFPYPALQFFVSGGTGTPPYSFAVTGGALPPVLSLGSLNGNVTGTPNTTGPFGFTVTVTDAAGAIGTQAVNITINVAPSITSGATLPQGTEGLVYAHDLSATGGTGGFTWAVTGGALPAGLTLSPGGTISGTPGTGSSGTYNPQISATDSAGATASKTFTLVIGTGPIVSDSNPPDDTINRVMNDTNLVLTFNMPMVKASVQSRFNLSPATGGTHQYFWDTPPANPNGSVVTVVFDTVAPFGVITGDDLLADDTIYTWTITSGAQSASALVMPMQTGSFKSQLDTTPPSVLSITPDPKGIVDNVTQFVIKFSEAMDASGMNGSPQVNLQSALGQSNVSVPTATGALTAQWTASDTLTIGFSPALAANTGYRLQISNLRDADGVRLENDLQYNVLTKGTMAGAPYLTANYPPNGASGVSRDCSIFIATSENVEPNVAAKLQILGASTLFAVRNEYGGNGPTGFSITPKAGWPANTAITVKIPGGAGGVTNASLVPFAADTTFTFTTGADGLATNPIVIDDPFSSLKTGWVDCDTFSGLQGELFFKDSVTGNRAYMDDSTLINQAISVTDPNGIPVKGFIVNAFGGDEPGRSLRLDRQGSGISPLQQNATYTVTFKGTIASSTGMSFSPVSYTFTTVPDSTTRVRAQPSINDTQSTTTLLPPPAPAGTVAKQVQFEVDVYSGFSTIVAKVDATDGTNTAYYIQGGLPGWVLPGVTQLLVSGCTAGANNGTYTVVSIDNSGPGPTTTVTLNNPAGVAQLGSAGQISTLPYVVTADDVTGSGNTFSQNVPQDPSNPGRYRYKTGDSAAESGFATAGDHTMRLTVDDGNAAHLFQVNTSMYFFPDADILALTLDPTSPPPGGLTPTFSWSWASTVPTSVTALAVSVVQTVPNVPGPGTHDVTIGTWIIPPNLTSFVLPSNMALQSGGNYKWQMGYFHSTDGTLRDHGGDSKAGQVSFSEP